MNNYYVKAEHGCITVAARDAEDAQAAAIDEWEFLGVRHGAIISIRRV